MLTIDRKATAPAYARSILGIDELVCQLAAEKTRMSSWVAGYMTKQGASPYYLSTWGKISGASASNGFTAAPNSLSSGITFGEQLVNSRPAIYMPAGTYNELVMSTLQTSASYTLYFAGTVAFTITGAAQLGLFGSVDQATNNALMLRLDRAADGTTYSFQMRNRGLTGHIVSSTGGWNESSPFVMWASYDSSTNTMYIGGTDSGIVALSNAGTILAGGNGVTDPNPTVTTGCQWSSVASFVNANVSLVHGITADTCLYTNSNAAHQRIVRNLAAQLGLSAA